jgi:hypothetical protein
MFCFSMFLNAFAFKFGRLKSCYWETAGCLIDIVYTLLEGIQLVAESSHSLEKF